MHFFYICKNALILLPLCLNKGYYYYIIIIDVALRRFTTVYYDLVKLNPHKFILYYVRFYLLSYLTICLKESTLGSLAESESGRFSGIAFESLYGG